MIIVQEMRHLQTELGHVGVYQTLNDEPDEVSHTQTYCWIIRILLLT